MARKQKRSAPVRRHVSDVTYAQLKQIDAEQPRRLDKPKALRLDQIIVADKVFQLRRLGFGWEHDQDSANHVSGLASQIKAGGFQKPLDPVLVVPVGASFYLVDGHHRVDAYSAAQWLKPIPVEVFSGSLAQARDEAYARNSKNKLALSRECKLEVAWMRFNEGDLSQRKLAELIGVAPRTVANMSKRAGELKAEGKDPTAMPWREAKGRQGDEDFDYPEHVRKSALEMAEELKKVPNFLKDPRVVAAAIKVLSDKFPAQLVSAWEGVADDEGGQYWQIEVDPLDAITTAVRHVEARGDHELAERLRGVLEGLHEEKAAEMEALGGFEL